MQDRLLKYKFTPYLVIFLFWNIIAVLATTLLYAQFVNTYPDASWLGFFYRQAPIWYIWMFFTPLILWLVNFGKKSNFSLPKNILTHLLVASVLFLIYGFLVGIHSLNLNQKLVWSTSVIYPSASRSFVLNFASNCLIYLLIVFVGVGLQWYQSLVNTQQARLKLELHNSELHAQLVEAQLQTLTRQLQPHFLFNTLHSIASLVRTQQNSLAIQMIADFSELLRHTIQQGEENFATIETEVAFIEKYLNIEKIRFQDRLEVSIQVSTEAKPMLVPSLILQPFIENAIKHGISSKSDNGCIEVVIGLVAQQLDIQIRDNGVGLSKGWKLTDNQGVGLSNSLHRMEKVYAQNFSLNLNNHPEGGVLVHLQLSAQAPIHAKSPIEHAID
ncbi:MAG TPA: hypothetical protein DCS93_40375 [Microscillaceae bacterium]|nr:hypothetical protein [Microscillaceae bacterium]